MSGDSSGASSSLTAAISQLKNHQYDFKLSGVFMWSGWFGLECNTADYYNKQLDGVFVFNTNQLFFWKPITGNSFLYKLTLGIMCLYEVAQDKYFSIAWN